MEGPPLWDAVRAASMVGKRVLVGLTHLDGEGRVVELRQIHGRIVSADERRGFVVDLEGAGEGKTYALPPDTRAFRDAPRGEYRLRSTGEVVVDPDLLTTWTVDAPSAGASPQPPGSRDKPA